MNVKAMAHRVIVFRATKRLMEELGRCPTPLEVFEEVETDVSIGLSRTRSIFTDLNGADGLQYPTYRAGRHNVINEAGGHASSGYRAAAIRNHDETSCPVDILMQG